MFTLDEKITEKLSKLKDAVSLKNNRSINKHKRRIKEDFKKYEILIGEEYNKEIAKDAVEKRFESLTVWVTDNVEEKNRSLFNSNLLAG